MLFYKIRIILLCNYKFSILSEKLFELTSCILLCVQSKIFLAFYSSHPFPVRPGSEGMSVYKLKSFPVLGWYFISMEETLNFIKGMCVCWKEAMGCISISKCLLMTIQFSLWKVSFLGGKIKNLCYFNVHLNLQT